MRHQPAAVCPKGGGHPVSETVVVDLETAERLHGTSWKGRVVSTWDMAIFNEDANVDFLDDLADLDFDEAVEAVRDACLLAGDKGNATEEEILNGQAAATIAAIWAGAPFSAGEVASLSLIHI